MSWGQLCPVPSSFCLQVQRLGAADGAALEAVPCLAVEKNAETGWAMAEAGCSDFAEPRYSSEGNCLVTSSHCHTVGSTLLEV